MCNSMTLIQSVVSEKVGSNAMFTAYDVSVEVQKRASLQGLPVERHADMKRDIHNAMQQISGYEKSLVDVGAATRAFLYHPQGTNPLTYVPMPRNDSPVSPHAVVQPDGVIPVSLTSTPSDNSVLPTDSASTNAGPVVSNVVAVATTQPQSNGGTPTDNRGRLCVPNHMLRALGFQPKDTAQMSLKTDASGNYISVSKTLDILAAPLALYVVDKDVNIRITNTQLMSLTDPSIGRPHSGTTYDINLNASNNEIVIRRHN